MSLTQKHHIALIPAAIIVLLFICFGNSVDCYADGLKKQFIGKIKLVLQPDATKFKIVPPFAFSLLPKSYDLRKTARAATVRAEQGCASCWSSAATYIMESSLMVANSYNFSETHMQMSQLGECHAGASVESAMGYLTGWRGPVTEWDYVHLALKNSMKIQERAHVQRVTYLPLRNDPLDNDWIKYFIYTYGPVYASVGMRGITNQANSTYYWPGNSSAHAVAIVGWDNNFSKEKFTYTINGTTYTPPGNGAFIAKNNAGPDFGENGFYYISYYDGTIGYNTVTSFEVEPLSNYQHNYQYDPAGFRDWIGPVDVPDPSEHYQDAIIGANVFTAGKTEELAAIGFFVKPFMLSPNERFEYQIAIHLDPVSGPVNPVGPALSFKTQIAQGGYHTILLPSRIQLNTNQKFSIILMGRSTNNNAAWLPVERKSSSGKSCLIEIEQSFVSRNSLSWFDLSEIVEVDTETGVTKNVFCNLGIKAYSTPLPDNKANTKGIYSVYNADKKTISVTNQKSIPVKVRITFKREISGYKKFGRKDGILKTKNNTSSKGWIEIAPGESTQIIVPNEKNIQLNNLYYKIDYLNLDNTIINLSKWRLIAKLSMALLQLISTDPQQGATIPPGLTQLVARFDKAIQPGPGFQQITLTSPGEVKSLYSMVSDKELYIIPVGPLFTPELGGKQWAVTLPADAVTDKYGNPMKQPYSWTFTVIGVN